MNHSSARNFIGLQNNPSRVKEVPEVPVQSPSAPMLLPLACKVQSVNCQEHVRFKLEVL